MSLMSISGGSCMRYEPGIIVLATSQHKAAIGHMFNVCINNAELQNTIMNAPECPVTKGSHLCELCKVRISYGNAAVFSIKLIH